MDKNGFLKALGNRIVSIRLTKNLSQSDLARACDKDRQSLERLENGKVNPSIFYLKEVADGLKVPLHVLLNFEEF